ASTNPNVNTIDKNVLKQLLNKEIVYRHKAIRIIAEICKEETQRKECISYDFFTPLIDIFETGTLQEQIESCRAVGNMCYENSDGCELMDKSIGLQRLLDLCRISCKTNDKEGAQLRMMTLGALHNIVNSNEYENLLSSRFLFSIGDTLSESVIYENRAILLPYFLEAAEEDSMKAELCSSSLYFKLITLCEQYAGKDEEFLRETCYILILLITTDKAIDHLLSRPERDLLECGIKWLETDNLQLNMTGALIITNLTRNDQAATGILLDARQPHLKLVQRLQLFSSQLQNQLASMSDEQAKVAHGVLGALRNLAVPKSNHVLLINNDVADVVIPYMFSRHFDGEIAYKATGVLRFLLREAKETTKLSLFDDKILTQIVENGNAHHLGLQFEARRVLFLMPIALRTTDAIKAMARTNSFPLILSTIASCEVQNRSLVQNEALVALNIILIMSDENVRQKLIEANFHESVKQFLNQDIQHDEVINNILQMIHLVQKYDQFLTSEQILEYGPLLQKLRASQNSSKDI
ncbi:unnamed protein product, partial [Didymodactylos carnosus]